MAPSSPMPSERYFSRIASLRRADSWAQAFPDTGPGSTIRHCTRFSRYSTPAVELKPTFALKSIDRPLENPLKKKKDMHFGPQS